MSQHTRATEERKREELPAPRIGNELLQLLSSGLRPQLADIEKRLSALEHEYLASGRRASPHEKEVGTRCINLLKPEQAADRLALSPRKLWSLTNDGTVPCIRIGRSVRYCPEQLRRWIEGATAPVERAHPERPASRLKKGRRAI